jgi:signal transduction histidine kinase
MHGTFLQQDEDAKFRILAEVSSRITSILDIDQLLTSVVHLIQETFDYYHVGIGLIEGEEVVYRVGAGALWDSPGFRFRPGRLKIGAQGISGWVAATGKAALIPDVSKDTRYIWMQGSATRSELIVPIIIREQTIGVLDVQSERLNGFSDVDFELIQALANQAGVAIQNARLYDRARQMAVMEERQRLARELHDSVTQSLYGVSLYAEAASGHFARGNVDKAAQYMQDIKTTALESLADMRLLIFELRHPLLEKEGLVSMLRSRLFSVEKRAGIQVALESNLDRRLPPSAEKALYGIANEALNNTLKHARATKVAVELRDDAGTVTMEVSDDGVGFDPASAEAAGGLGLSGMRERAQREGWQLEINTAPGRGTRVAVTAAVDE